MKRMILLTLCLLGGCLAGCMAMSGSIQNGRFNGDLGVVVRFRTDSELFVGLPITVSGDVEATGKGATTEPKP